MRDDLSTKRPAGQLMQGLKTVHEENNPGRALCPGAPVRPHTAAERIGISPVGTGTRRRWRIWKSKGLWSLTGVPATLWGSRSTCWESAA